jgi:hypothetical protein
MATLGEVRIPKKRITTYGKAPVRRRLADFSFTSVAPRSLSPEKRRSESEASRSPSLAPSLPPAEPKKLKSISRKSPSKTPPLLSPASHNVFDVPSSDEETLQAPKPVRKTPQPSKAAAKKKVLKGAGTKETVRGTSVDLESRKRVKLSPALLPLLPQKSFHAVSGPKRPISEITKNTPKQLPKMLGLGQTSTMVSRPKPALAWKPVDLFVLALTSWAVAWAYSW